MEDGALGRRHLIEELTMGARPPRTYVTQQQITDAIREVRLVARPDDILVEDQGRVVVLRPLTPRAERWLAARGPSRPITPGRAEHVVDRARADGLRVRR
jgi:hypothetical protein